MTDLVLDTVEALADVIVEGAALHSCAYIPFGRLNVPEDWFNAPAYGDIKLKLTGESAAGAVKVLTQQMRT